MDEKKQDEKIETIIAIEDILHKTNLNWSISYIPSAAGYGCYSIYISDEEPND